jgi:hypothetical protein
MGAFVSTLICEIVGKYRGPILIVAGGPSTLTDLPRLKEMGVVPTAVLSANHHGYMQDWFAPDFSVCCDPSHGETQQNMGTFLHSFGKPIITRCHFGDYRLPEWRHSANSGLTAVAVAVALGGNPVIVTGIDCYRMTSDVVYFHDPKAISNSTRKLPINFRKQITNIKQLCDGAHIRPMSGPLCDHFPTFDPAEKLRPVRTPPFVDRLAETKPIMVRAVYKKHFNFGVGRVPKGFVFPVSAFEARSLEGNHYAKVLSYAPELLR